MSINKTGQDIHQNYLYNMRVFIIVFCFQFSSFYLNEKQSKRNQKMWTGSLSFLFSPSRFHLKTKI